MMCFTTTFFSLFSIMSVLVRAKGPAPGGPPAHNNEETSCVSSLPSFKKHPGTQTVGNGIQAIFSSAVIECNGAVSSWSAYTKGVQERTIRFQIWRPTTYRMYTLVGENVLMNARSVNEVVTLNVDSEDSIHVQYGDIIGIYQETSADNSVKVKTKPDREGKMWQYMTSVGPSIGTLMELSVGNEFLQSKEEVPIISITIIDHDSINAAPTVPVPQSTRSSQVIQPTNTPSTPTGSANNNADSNQDFTDQSNSPRVNDNNQEEDDCDADKDKSMFLILVVLVMTIAILLLVVFILGTALILVSLKLRHAKDGSSTGTPSNSCNKDTYVGKQVVLIEEGHGRNGFTHNSIIGKPAIDNSIENPSYTVDKNERNQQMDNRITHDNQSNCTSSCSNQMTTIPVIAEVIRERTDSSSTTSTRGFNAQEYESPQMYSVTQSSIPHVIPLSAITRQPHYSRPRIPVPAPIQRQARIIPVESNVSYTQVPIKANNRKPNKRTVEHV